jgi:Tfp pilus assembly protein FimT
MKTPEHTNIKKTERGFTLVEMFVIIAIFGVMASVVLFKFRDFNKSVTLENLTQDIALRVVEAQKTAISGVLVGTTGTGGTPPSYGVYFRSNTTLDTNSDRFIYFTDTNGDKLYPTASSATPPCQAPYGVECLAVTKMTGREFVSRICYNAIGGTTYSCSTTSSAQVSFVRPFPDATIKVCASPTSCNTTSAVNAQSVYIQVNSGLDSNLKKTIIITNLGQVRVFNGCAGLAYPGGTAC